MEYRPVYGTLGRNGHGTCIASPLISFSVNPTRGHEPNASSTVDPALPSLANATIGRRGIASGSDRAWATPTPRNFSVRLLALRGLIGSALLALSASGATADGATGIDIGTRNDGTVFVSRGSTCSEDYALELRAAGIEVGVRRMGKLDSVASFVGLPAGPPPDHLVIINGYVIADHVGPNVIKDLLRQKPQIKGLAGIAKCPTPENHNRLDTMAARSF